MSSNPYRLPRNLVDGARARHQRARSTRVVNRRPEPFIAGKIPLWWVQEATQLPGSALAVGMMLWYFHGLNRGAEFQVSIGKISDLLSCSWDTARRGLRALRDAGLISVDGKPGQRSRIALRTELREDGGAGATQTITMDTVDPA